MNFRYFLIISVFVHIPLTLIPQTTVPSQQFGKIALVIGNGNYPVNILANPENDARAITEVLRKLGFVVYEYENLTQVQMKVAISDFGNRLKGNEVGLFYYAGHGIQANGFNYLIPIDADLKSEEAVDYYCIRADMVLASFETSETKVNVIIFDACRNNPFERSWTRTATGKGLAFMNAPKGTIIAYATAPGSTASDGYGKNGLYTSAILESIQIPNITIEEMFKRVRNIVTQKSNNEQTPWESTSLIGNFYFNVRTDSLLKFQDTSHTVLFTPKKKESFDYVIDPRDGKSYKTVKINHQIWMAQNLDYESHESESWCYDDLKYNCKEYGRLYSYFTAMEACPVGWHLPSDDEWKTLEINLGMSIEESNIRGAFKISRGEPLGRLLVTSDTLKFNILLAGLCNFDDTNKQQPNHSFQFLGRAAYFWTSTRTGINSAFQRMIYKSSKGILRSDTYPLSQGFSVRCVKD
jgi:uncharacterized protein (TIGR02145 family)